MFAALRGVEEYFRAVEICETQQHQLRLSFTARCPSYPLRDASGRRGRLESGGAGATSERKGSSGALLSTSPPPSFSAASAFRGGSFPSSTPPHTPFSAPSRALRATGRQSGPVPGVRRGCGRPALGGQPPARPVPRGAAGSAASPPPLRRPAPRTFASGPPSSPPKGARGAPLCGRARARARSRAEGTGPARVSHAPTCHAAASLAAPAGSERASEPAGRPAGHSPATEERSPGARSLLHLLSLRLAPSPRQRRAAPLPPSLLHRREGGAGLR